MYISHRHFQIYNEPFIIFNMFIIFPFWIGLAGRETCPQLSHLLSDASHSAVIDLVLRLALGLMLGLVIVGVIRRCMLAK